MFLLEIFLSVFLNRFFVKLGVECNFDYCFALECSDNWCGGGGRRRKVGGGGGEGEREKEFPQAKPKLPSQGDRTPHHFCFDFGGKEQHLYDA